MSSLRDLLAERVQTAREEAAIAAPRHGSFSHFDGLKLIHFTTVGRRSGADREKWWLPFAADGDVLYLLEEAGTAAHWVQNVIVNGAVVVEGAPATARIVEAPDEQARARSLCRDRFARVGLAVADLVETGLVLAFDAAQSTRTYVPLAVG